MSDSKQALSGRVRGLVQGVCFRVETRKMAMRLGLVGWVRNTADGDVELLIAGDEAALHNMQKWLSQGPELAQVTAVDLAPCALPETQGFEIRY